MLSCFRNLISNNKENKEEGFYLRNGAALLEHLIHDFNGKCNPIRMYSVKELSKATNDYKSDDDPIHGDGFYELYKGVNQGQELRGTKVFYELYKGVHQGQEILVKKFLRISNVQEEVDSITSEVEEEVVDSITSEVEEEVVDSITSEVEEEVDSITSEVEEEVDLIINEVAIASNMSNHKNFLKLIGCCLETELPTLVYEFPAKGNLSHHIFRESDHHIGLVWATKLKIAIQVADAVSYLHYGTIKVILHLDIRLQNIYLDQDYVAKLSEFQRSVLIPSGETPDVLIYGTIGYLAPEYALIGLASEKSDVYSFGCLLFELFAGKGVFSVLVENESADRSDANIWQTYLEDNMLDDENKKQVVECAKLVERCLQANPDERPVMTEVAQLLRSIKGL